MTKINPRWTVIVLALITLMGTLRLTMLAVPVNGSETSPGFMNKGAKSFNTATALVDAHNVELIGRYGGNIGAISAQGDYVYISMGLEFVVLDITDPVHPLPVRYLTISVADIFVVGDYAYVTGLDEGLRILDISDPTNPLQVGLLDGYADEIETVEDNTVYVHGEGRTLRIIDVSDPAVPVEIGTYRANDLSTLEVAGNYAYSLIYDSLYIQDISDPSTPIFVGSYQPTIEGDVLDLTLQGLALKEDIVYIVGIEWHDDYKGGVWPFGVMKIVDVSNPSAPGEISSIGLDNSDPSTVEVLGNLANGKFYAFFTGDSSGTGVVDVSEPTAPYKLDSLKGIILSGAAGGDYLYISLGSSLTVLNIYNLNYVGNYFGYIRDVTAVDDYAYVVTSRSLQILDVSTPTLPIQAGSLSGFLINSVSVSDGYAYLITNGDVPVVDISDSASPEQVGIFQLDPHGEGQAVAVANEHIYIAGGGGGLFIYQGGVPLIPYPLSRYGYRFYPYKIAIQTDLISVSGRTYAYILALVPYLYGGTETRMVVLDITDPFNLGQVGDLDLTGGEFQIYVAGNHAYISDTGEVRIVDITNPARPNEIGVLDGDIVETVEGTKLFLSGSEATLRVIDISDIANPIELGSYDYGGGLVEVENNIVYVLESDRLRIVDISDPTQPIEVGFRDIPKNDDYFEESFIVEGESAYICRGTCAYCPCEGSLLIIDLSDPTAPVEIVEMIDKYPTDFWATSDYHLIEFGYWDENCDERFTGGFDAWQVFEDWMFNGTIRGISGRGDFYPAATDAAIQENYAYIAYGYSHLEVWDISVSNWVLINSLDYNDNIYNVVAAGEYAYVSSQITGLQVLDISDPLAPVKVGLFGLKAKDIAVKGDYVYGAAGMSGLIVLNISNPANIYEVGSLDTPGDVQAVALSGNYAYIADGEAGLRVIDVSNPAAPTEVGSYDTDGIAKSVSVENNYIYLVDDSGDLLILQQLYSVSGKITHANGLPFPGVTISASPGGEAITSEEGLYRLNNLYSGTYTLTSTISNFTSWPSDRIVALPPDANAQDFTILPEPVSITLTPGTAGTLTYNDTQGLLTQLEFPADAVTQITTITLTPTLATPDMGSWFTGHAFDLVAFQDGTPYPDFAFNVPVVVTIHYSDYDVHVVSDESALGLWRQTGFEWKDVASTCNPVASYTRDGANNILQVPICSAGQFALFGPTHQLALPSIYR